MANYLLTFASLPVFFSSVLLVASILTSQGPSHFASTWSSIMTESKSSFMARMQPASKGTAMARAIHFTGKNPGHSGRLPNHSLQGQ